MSDDRTIPVPEELLKRLREYALACTFSPSLGGSLQASQDGDAVAALLAEPVTPEPEPEIEYGAKLIGRENGAPEIWHMGEMTSRDSAASAGDDWVADGAAQAYELVQRVVTHGHWRPVPVSGEETSK